MERSLETGEEAGLDEAMSALGLAGAGEEQLLSMLSPAERAMFRQLLESHADQVRGG